MQENTLTGLQDSGTNTQYRQSLIHLQIAPFSNGYPRCQSCGDTLAGGESVTLYLSRPVGRPGYTVDQCRCSEHNDDLTALFTLGVRELVIDGRIGQYHPQDAQQDCPELLSLSVRLVSSPDTKSGRAVGDYTETNPDIFTRCQASNSKSNAPDVEGRLQSVLSFTDGDSTADTTDTQSTGGFDDE